MDDSGITWSVSIGINEGYAGPVQESGGIWLNMMNYGLLVVGPIALLIESGRYFTVLPLLTINHGFTVSWRQLHHGSNALQLRNPTVWSDMPELYRLPQLA